MPRPAAATIHLDALRANLATVRRLCPRSKVMAVVKADGYGHGLERVAAALTGADAYGVAALSDAERLRAIGLTQRIVLLSGIHQAVDLAELRRLQVDTVIHHESQLELLESERDPAHLRVWLKIDSGMHRLGFPPERAVEAFRRLRQLNFIDDDLPIMTHFSRSDELDSEVTREQIRRFSDSTATLQGQRSLANSAAVLGWPDSHADWVRPGGALFGLSVVEGHSAASLGLQAAMTLSTEIIAINDVRVGEAVGYGGRYVADRPVRVGIAAIGYGDGYPRHLPSGSPVLVDGRRVATVGRVSMDLLAVDLSKSDDARVGSKVTLWGRGLPVEEVAQAAGTISYELTCGITRRVAFLEAESGAA